MTLQLSKNNFNSVKLPRKHSHAFYNTNLKELNAMLYALENVGKWKRLPKKYACPPPVVGRMYDYELDDYLLDIGASENLQKQEGIGRMIISKTPFRISFVGGGTDLEAYYKTGYGAVVSAAIRKYIYVTVHKRFDNTIRVSYTQTEIVNQIQDLKHSIVRACMEMADIKNGVEITMIGEVPASTGLGSSSTLTVGLLNALFAYKGVMLNTRELIEMACKIEIDILRSPIGKQDQAAAALGGLNYIRFNADGSVENENVALSEKDVKKLESKLLLFYTGITRNANDIMGKMREDIIFRRETLDAMRDQADAMRDLLLAQGVNDRFGNMLHEGWERKRSVTEEISSSTIDGFYQKALDCGACGGKLLGAGGGGFFLFYCAEDKQDALRQALGLKELDFRIARYGSRIVYFE